MEASNKLDCRWLPKFNWLSSCSSSKKGWLGWHLFLENVDTQRNTTANWMSLPTPPMISCNKGHKKDKQVHPWSHQKKWTKKHDASHVPASRDHRMTAAACKSWWQIEDAAGDSKLKTMSFHGTHPESVTVGRYILTWNWVVDMSSAFFIMTLSSWHCNNQILCKFHNNGKPYWHFVGDTFFNHLQNLHKSAMEISHRCHGPSRVHTVCRTWRFSMHRWVRLSPSK